MERFTLQKEKHQHLLKLKEDNEKMLQQLREHKELLNKELQDVKYSGEAQVSRWVALAVLACVANALRELAPARLLHQRPANAGVATKAAGSTAQTRRK